MKKELLTSKERGNRVVFICSICVIFITIALILLSFTGCSSILGDVEELKGDITGNTYECKFYSNDGKNFMNVSGEKINMESNIVEEASYDSKDGWGTIETMSAVVNINIDGNQINNCGSTVLFIEKGLKEEVDFSQENIDIKSTANGFGDNTFIAGTVNKYKNFFGNNKVVVIQSQLGDPICAFSGDKVNWKISESLPKTTRITIDGKLLYIHRANFQIVDKNLLK